jgi:hypothetical protein
MTGKNSRSRRVVLADAPFALLLGFAHDARFFRVTAIEPNEGQTVSPELEKYFVGERIYKDSVEPGRVPLFKDRNRRMIYEIASVIHM